MHIYNPTKTVVPVLVFVLFLVVPNNTAQQLKLEELDSIYYKFIQVRAPYLLEQPVELTSEERKCGFEIVNRVKFNLNSFSLEQQAVLKPLLQRPVMQTSIVSPSGFFRIHYDTTGFSIPSYLSGASIEANIQEVAAAIDSSYRFEVDYLGYPQPPSDGNEGGDNLYDVYIINQPSGLYGFTQFETEVEPNSDRYTSYQVIDNDYTGYFSEGINGLRVTAAHEFHHAIQGGNYIFRASDTYFYEITSTAMEEFVFDNVNDYYAYMSSYFNVTGRAFAKNNGYNLAIWNIFLKDIFNFNIIKRQWELMPSMRALYAISQSIEENSSTFGTSLANFGIWCFYTNHRTMQEEYFEEAINYPLITPITTLFFSTETMVVDINAAPTSNNYVTIIDVTTNPHDTLVTLVSNLDVVSGVENINSTFLAEYILSLDSLENGKKITDKLFSKFTAETLSDWSNLEFFNNILISKGVILSDFRSLVIASSVYLRWTTSFEVENLGFMIERGIDSLTFEEIAFLPGQLFSLVQTEYEFEDKSLPEGSYYYRVKQINIDSTFQYLTLLGSKVIKIDIKNSENLFELFQNFPNPFYDKTEILFISDKNGSGYLKLFNSLGQLINILFSGNIEANHLNIVELSSENLASGAYFYQLVQGERALMKKLLVVK